MTIFSAASLACVGLALNCEASGISISLGTASNYAVLGLTNTGINNSLVTINGNEGVSQGGTLTNMAPSVVNGNVYEAKSGQLTGPGTVNGNTFVVPSTMSQNDNDALSAASAAEGLTPTQTLTGVNSATTITGNGGLNVIAVNGNISKALTLSGTSNDMFVVLVTGNVALVGSDSLGLGGAVTAANVLYVVTGDVSTKVGNTVNGTLLGVNSNFNLDGTFNGEIIGGGSQIQLMSGAVVNAIPFNTAPEPSTMALFGSGLVMAGLVFRKRMRRSQAQ